jgi:DoxX-like family
MAQRGRAAIWTGRVLSTLVGLAFLFSAGMKFAGGTEVEKGMEHLGLPSSFRVTLGVLELTCAVVYLIPQTTVLGAILLTGYLGGAMLAHLRIGEGVPTHIVLGILLWLGVALRDGRLWKLIPVRRPDAATIRTDTT